MRNFIHYKKQNAEKFLAQLSGLQQKYIERSFDFEQELTSHFDEAESFFQQLGENLNQSGIARLQTYFVTAQRGIDPRKLEKLKTGRRENIWISAFDCLSQLEELFASFLGKQQLKLDEGKELIEQIILSIIQNNGPNGELILQLESLESIESFWRSLMAANEQIKLAHRRLLLNLNEQDIYLLIEATINRIRTST